MIEWVLYREDLPQQWMLLVNESNWTPQSGGPLVHEGVSFVQANGSHWSKLWVHGFMIGPWESVSPVRGPTHHYTQLVCIWMIIYNLNFKIDFSFKVTSNLK